VEVRCKPPRVAYLVPMSWTKPKAVFFLLLDDGDRSIHEKDFGRIHLFFAIG
jgi:hypothetical protein